MIFAKIIKGAKPGAEPKRRGPDADVLSIVSVGNWEAADAGSVQCHDRSLGGQNSAWIPQICATFQGDNLRRHF
jgi:hypothetical protein